jgi:hypothetical protein
MPLFQCLGTTWRLIGVHHSTPPRLSVSSENVPLTVQ